ncbi:MAG: hypothetical protein CM1200mP27_02230 [Chloroflexota bacterium]|nr:MAG: hypothetical protein CM1200mP27_02230 [Chloroflexota bacterium]
MAYVTPREGENPESLVNPGFPGFRPALGYTGELKDRRFFRSKAQKERLAAQRAARRRRRQTEGKTPGFFPNTKGDHLTLNHDLNRPCFQRRRDGPPVFVEAHPVVFH